MQIERELSKDEILELYINKIYISPAVAGAIGGCDKADWAGPDQIAGANTDVGGDSWNYGVGANYYLDGKNGVRADWTRRDFTDDNGGELDTYGLSYVRRF